MINICGVVLRRTIQCHHHTIHVALQRPASYCKAHRQREMNELSQRDNATKKRAQKGETLLHAVGSAGTRPTR
jgi:hypothetical protein